MVNMNNKINVISNLYYTCKECASIHCSLPSMCRYCSCLLLNEMNLAQMKDVSYKSDLKYDQVFVKISYLYDKIFNKDKELHKSYDQMRSKFHIDFASFDTYFFNIKETFSGPEIPLILHIKHILIFLKQQSKKSNVLINLEKSQNEHTVKLYFNTNYFLCFRI